MRTFIVVWQDQEDRRWWPVGKLIHTPPWYLFFYTHGAKQATNFRLFPGLTNIDVAWASSTLFAFLSNRIISKNRPDFQKYATWSGFELDSGDPLAVMATTGGARATDMLQVYELPQRTADGRYETTFFSHGLSHLPRAALDHSFTMRAGDILFPMLDTQNPFDKEAVALRTDDPALLIGYCPRHMCFDIKDLIRQYDEAISIKVKKVNTDAPPAFRLLIQANARWPNDFKPCNRIQYKTVVNEQKVIRQIQQPMNARPSGV